VGDGKFDGRRRDFADFGHIADRYTKLINAGKMTESMPKRLQTAGELVAVGDQRPGRGPDRADQVPRS